MKVFLDTNVLASALATRGLCKEVLDIVITAHQLVSCHLVLDELQDVLARKFRVPAPIIREGIAMLKAEAEFAPRGSRHPMAVKEINDREIIASAIEAKVDIFVTGDKELLTLAKVRIASPRAFWEDIAGLVDE